MMAIDDKFQQALGFHQQGQLAQAQALYEEVLKTQPRHFDALHLLGVIAAQTNNPQQALALFDRALAVDSSFADAHFNRGTALQNLKQWRPALASYDRAIAMKPELAEAYSNRAVVLTELKQLEAALASCNQAIGIRGSFAEAFFNRGTVLSHLGRREAAIASYNQAIAIRSNYPEAFFNRGNEHIKLEQWEAALACYGHAIASRPDYVDAYVNLGNVQRQLKHWEAALRTYDQVIAIKPDDGAAHCNRGNVLRDLKRPEAALASYDRAIEINPNCVEAHCNRGNVLRELNRLEAALGSYDRAIAISPSCAEAHSGRGNLLTDLHRPDLALASYDRAISIEPDFALACSNQGNALRDVGRLEAALASCNRAIALQADCAEAYYNRGHVQRDLKLLDLAASSYARALSLKPDIEYLLGQLRYTKMEMCDWRDVGVDAAQLIARIERDEAASYPFPILVLSDSAAVQKRAAEICVRHKYPLNRALPAIRKYAKHRRIHVGYFSADFHDHATSRLIVELLEWHDRSRFQVTAFSFGPESQDAMRRRLTAACDHFVDVQRKSDLEVATLARKLQVDIAVDLKGFTQDNRLGLFALRAAPLQVNYLGYPGTIGADYMDYLIADRVLIPEESQRHYTEKIIYLPHSYQANDAKRTIADKAFTRAEFGLPEVGFVFCCFNNNYKIMPDTFARWMRILGRVEGSVLWLLEDNPIAASNLRREAVTRNVNPERLVFARRIDLPEHLARHRLANLFLDTLPCNAHTTASDALWAGLPVLTLAGEGFASRVAASLLTAIHLPELIASTPEQYEEMAVQLAADTRRLAGIRQRLADNRLTTPLFNTQLFTKGVEAGYLKIYERYQANLPAAHVYLSESQEAWSVTPGGDGACAGR